MSYFVSITYGITALVFGALAYFQESEMLNIAVNETFIVLPQSLLWIVLGILFVIFAGISLTFELAKKPMYQSLFIIHILLTVAGIISLYYITQEEPAPNQFVDYSAYQDVQNAPEPPAEPIQWITYVLYVLIGAQVVFVINFLLSLFKSRKAKKLASKNNAA